MLKYVLTFVALIALTGLTFGLSFLHLGEWSVVIAMTIAMAKGVLVALFFMHLVEQRTSTRVTALVALLLIAVFISLSALDVSSRREPDGIGADAAAAFPR